jgi:hypothetical protein
MVTGYFAKFVAGTGVFLWLAIMLVGLAVERLRPVEKGQPRSNIVLNLIYSS